MVSHDKIVVRYIHRSEKKVFLFPIGWLETLDFRKRCYRCHWEYIWQQSRHEKIDFDPRWWVHSYCQDCILLFFVLLFFIGFDCDQCSLYCWNIHCFWVGRRYYRTWISMFRTCCFILRFLSTLFLQRRKKQLFWINMVWSQLKYIHIIIFFFFFSCHV